MPTNDFLPFATGGGANVLTQAQYAALTSLLANGFSTGTALSAQLNKVWRQSSFVAAAVAQLMVDATGQNVADDGVLATFEKQLALALALVNYGVDTGAANVYQVTFLPAEIAIQDGVRLRFRAANANTGSSTFSPNGLTAKPIWNASHSALVAGEIVAGGEVELVWDSAINGGSGAWVMLGNTGGILDLPVGSFLSSSPAQFDATTKIATMEALQRAIGNMRGYQFLSASTSLDSSHSGKFILFSGAAGQTLTLPSVTASGEVIVALCGGANSVSITPSTGNMYRNSPGAGTILTATMTLTPGDSVYLVSEAGVGWHEIGCGRYADIRSAAAMNWSSAINVNVGLNTFTTPGSYRAATTDATTHDGPTTAWNGELLVLANSGFISQILVDHTSENLYFRTASGGPSFSWSAWKTVNTNVLTLGTAVNTTSGTAIDFTGIPSWVKRITIMLNGVSTVAADTLLIQIGSGSIDATGYSSGALAITGAGAASEFGLANGFALDAGANASDTRYGTITLTNLTGNVWTATSALYRTGTAANTCGAGAKTLAGTLDRVRLTTNAGTNAFDAGSMNILYE